MAAWRAAHKRPPAAYRCRPKAQRPAARSRRSAPTRTGHTCSATTITHHTTPRQPHRQTDEQADRQMGRQLGRMGGHLGGGKRRRRKGKGGRLGGHASRTGTIDRGLPAVAFQQRAVWAKLGP